MKTVLMAACVVALVGCGGGSDDPLPQAPTQIQSLDVWKSFLSADLTFVTRGVGTDGASYEISTTVRPRGNVQFAPSPDSPTATFMSVEIASAVRRNNAAPSNTSLLFYIRPSDYSVAALINPTGTTNGASCIVPDSSGQTPPVPATTALNATGQLFSGRPYVYSGTQSRCFPPNGVIGAPSYAINWSYEADGSRPLFCVNMRISYGGANASAQSNCVEVINSASTGSAARVSVASPAISFATRNY